jgi:hypothetical protein
MRIVASSRVRAATGSPGSTNCGISVVKKTAIFGFKRFGKETLPEGRSRASGPIVRHHVHTGATPCVKEGADAEVDQVRGSGELEHGEGERGGVQKGRDPKCGSESPDEHSGDDSDRRLKGGAAS